MALFKIFKGLKKNLPTDKYIDGWCYVTTDDGKMYIDTKDNDSSGRIVLNAEKADKLTVSAGSTNQPVYFKDGVPTKISYTIKKSVPSDAVFTDTHNVSSNVINKTASSTADTTSALTNGNVYLNHIDGGAVTSSHKISGSGATSVTADADGNIIISSTNSTYGAAGSGLGLVKSGGDVTITDGVINVNDNSHGHIIGNIEGLQSALNAKSNTGHTHWIHEIKASSTAWPDQTLSGSNVEELLMSAEERIVALESDKAPNNHASTSKTYGVGNGTNYGHVKLSSATNETATITDGIAATPAAVKAVNDKAITGLSVSGKVITYTKGDGTTGSFTTKDTIYSLPLASSSTRGGVKIGYTQSGKNYPVQLSNEKMYVNVPWTDTTYTFTNKNVTLAWGTKSTIATVGGTDITVTMPANPNTNTHYSAYLYATDSSGTAHAATTNGNTYLRLIENSTARSSIKVAGAGLTTVSSDAKGNITISTLNGTNAGDSNTPVYLNGGTFTECTSLDLNTTGSAAKLAGGTTLTSSTVDGFLEKNMVKWAPTDNTAVGANDGVVMSFGWSSAYGAQIWLDDGPSEGGMKIRNRNSSGWNAWRQVLTEHNYNSYSPTLTGTGASGTWGISITGNAATATTATKLATARNIQVNLASTSAASFNGTAAITPGVTGTLAVGNGGTGRTSLVTPTVTWTGGTSAGPTLKIKDSLNKTSRAVAIPSASSSASGIITTSDQSIAGFKTFASGIQVTGTFQTKGEFEIYGSAPHIDFHFNNSTTDYTSRIIETSAGVLSSTAKFYGAVWNDYAEFRTQKETIEPGYCVASTNNGQVYKTTEKFQACDGIVSDTFGFAIGETDECKTPLAVAGRVLAYFHGNREDYNAGDTVCAGPEGKVMKMTREEIKEYPDRIIGIVSEIPEYKIWGSGNVEVNNRIWIKVK